MGNSEQPRWTDKKGWQRGDDAEKEVWREYNEELLARSQQNFRAILEAQGGAIEETLELKDGLIKEKGSDRYRFLSCVPRRSFPGAVLQITADDVRQAARVLCEKYPRILVEFDEDRTSGILKYRATLKPSE